MYLVGSKFGRVVFSLVFLWLTVHVYAAQPSSPFSWAGDTLIVSDGLSKQGFLFRQGKLKTVFSNRETGPSIREDYAEKDVVSIPEDAIFISESVENDYTQPTTRTSGFFSLRLKASFDVGEVEYRITVFDDCPGIEWQFSTKGDLTRHYQANKTGSEQKAIEHASLLSSASFHYFSFPLGNRHHANNITAFSEATDHHNNLVWRQSILPYSKSSTFSANIVTADNPLAQSASLIVKLSPIGAAQSNYDGYDFSVDFDAIRVISTGFDTTDSDWKEQWHRSYPVFVLRHVTSEEEALLLYKRYELSVHRYVPERDNTFTMNTWGNRNRDSRIREDFILNELDKAAQLGITHYQIDDGWQAGLSQNSSLAAGKLWDDWSASDWEINRERFPNGFDVISQKASANAIQLGLWFNPSKRNRYENWQRDSDILVNLNKSYQVGWIKIDGVELGNRTSEERVSSMLIRASSATDGILQFNMDVTAGRRGGYFFLNRVGNVFLENRYTDWANYYPHLTLRNAWQLARYVPIQRLQIEWLDKWRNDGKYPSNDPLRPSQIPFDYQFAVAMIGQPLAWMEATALPEEALEIKPLIETWKANRSDMLTGVIHPIGESPTGFGFTGFSSFSAERVYVLLYRELTADNTYDFVLPFGYENIGNFTKLWGDGTLTSLPDAEGVFTVTFDDSFRFLWGYFDLVK